MKLLCIADFHELSNGQYDFFKELDINLFDVVLLLGDNCRELLKLIQETWSNKKPVLGVLGNHDYFDILNDYEIANIHGEVVTINENKISGIQGSYAYKNSRSPMYSQGESFVISSTIPVVDILISHTSPYGIHEQDEDIHLGLFGILNYIEKNKPKLNIHGHQHINKTTKMESGTVIISVYGAAIIDIEQGNKDILIDLE